MMAGSILLIVRVDEAHVILKSLIAMTVFLASGLIGATVLAQEVIEISGRGAKLMTNGSGERAAKESHQEDAEQVFGVAVHCYSEGRAIRLCDTGL